jgi:hypothetical protein
VSPSTAIGERLKSLSLVIKVLLLIAVAGFVIIQHRTGRIDWTYGQLTTRYVERSIEIHTAASQFPILRPLVNKWRGSSDEIGTWAITVCRRALTILELQNLRPEIAEVQLLLAITMAEYGHRDSATDTLRQLVSS